MPDAVQGGFGVQFSEAIDNLKGKLPEATLRWDDLAGPVHGKVFAVAGAVQADLLADLHQALINAMANGTTITQFRKDFDAAVQKAGWSYTGKRGWRTRIIFDTNMRSAHMAGRWQQLQANKSNRPYLQYRTAGDARVRPQHRLWNGQVHALDSAFWQTHYPPNGWGCRCTVRAFSQADIDSKGIQVQPAFDPKAMPTRLVQSRDGLATDQVPIGIDPGWDHNVGRSWITPEVALGQKLAALPLELRGPMVDRTISPAFQTVLNERFTAFRTALKASGKPSGAAQIVGYLDSAIVNALATELAEVQLESISVITLDSKTTHLEGHHKSKSAQQWPDAWINALPTHFRNYQAVLLDLNKNTLVVVPQASFNDRLPKIVVQLNQSTKVGKAASVISLGSAKSIDLANTKAYKLLLGKL